MPYLFHQNLDKFGGAGDPSKIKLLTSVLTSTRMGLGSKIMAAGFTEITNARSSLSQLPKLFGALVLQPYVIAAVGNTAIANKDEFISIAWNPDFLTVSSVGLVQGKSGGGFRFDEINYNPRQITYDFPPGTLTDSRGLLYVAGTDQYRQNCVIGFMHNVYSVGNISLFPSNLGIITKYLASIHNNAKVMLGGDFNVPPSGIINSYGHSCTALDGAGQYLNTTLSNPYDWWYVDNASPISDINASLGKAIVDTTYGPMKMFPSDHYPILLGV